MCSQIQKVKYKYKYIYKMYYSISTGIPRDISSDRITSNSIEAFAFFVINMNVFIQQQASEV